MSNVMFGNMTFNEAVTFIDSYGGLFPLEVAKSRYKQLNKTYNSSGLARDDGMELRKLEKSIKLLRDNGITDIKAL